MPSGIDRRRRILARLPPLEAVLRGSVIVRSLRCGKPGCHCAEGERHRATYLSVTHAGGRTEQISLPAELVPLAERGVAAYRAWWAAIEKLSAINRDRIRQQRRQQAVLRRRSAGRSPRPRRPG
ncbi:MAG: DUF6788 family protein [Longimicrobiales bacterium]